ncbi:hypothetical protein E2C01_050656 [Portunus trituberculatus]|uniref:Uncharacterized protein n=1 Tax=Portunus trituberculatus TaxID=210409 RepID=A0A5B7G9K0_PORTR|nr:hypothetical protein [Portunus trituberculatus]
MAKYQGSTWWDLNLCVDICPIPHSPPYPLGHHLHTFASSTLTHSLSGVHICHALRNLEEKK